MIEGDPRIVRRERDPPGNPVANIGDQHRVLRVMLRPGDELPLILDHARIGIKCFQVVEHGFVENLAQRCSVLFACRTYLQLRPHGCRTHGPGFYHPVAELVTDSDSKGPHCEV